MQMDGLFKNISVVAGSTKIKKESAGAGRLGGGVGFKLEYNVPDCQGGYAITKVGTGQVIGCYTTKEHAEQAMAAIAVNEPVVKAETDQNLDGVDDPLTFWGASFSPFIHQPKMGEPMVPTYNTPPQHDGEPNVGYGNRSDKHGRSNS
jgi:hypothetical protein